jgi:zinc transport system substrate-binding protein
MTLGLSRWIILLALIALPNAGAAGKKLKIITSFLPAYCFTVAITGERAQVENLLSSSVEPHDYQLSPGDLRKLESADLIVVNGLDFEPWLQKVSAIRERSGRVVALAKGIGSDVLVKNAQGENNPHIWLDPALAFQSVTNILKAVQALDPDQSAAYESNFVVFVARLQKMDLRIKAILAPANARPFLTYHDAFPYFARHFGLTLAGVVEKVPEIPPSARELVELFRLIRQMQVQAIFTEVTDPPRLAGQIARDAGISLSTLDTIETGPMDPSSYEKAMLKNAATLAAVLAK